MEKVQPSSERMRINPADVAKQIKCLLKELPDNRADSARLDELRRLFSQLEAAGELTFTAPTKFDATSIPNHVTAKWIGFLHKSHDSMVSQLCERVTLGRHSSIRCLWGVIAGSPRSFTTKIMSKHQGEDEQRVEPPSYKCVDADLIHKWVWAMTLQKPAEMDKRMRNMCQNELLSPFRDVQYFSLSAITKLATSAYEGCYKYDNNEMKVGVDDEDSINSKKERVAEKLLELLMMIQVPYSDEELEKRKQFLFPPPKDVAMEVNVVESDESNEETEDESSDSDSEDELREEEASRRGKTSARPTKRQKKSKTYKFPFQQVRMFRREYKKAWLAVLRLTLPTTSLKIALHHIPQNVLKCVAQPLYFSDFFIRAYSDHGSGIIGILALDGLFLLITKCKNFCLL